VMNIDDHPDRVKNDIPNSTHRTDFLHVRDSAYPFLFLYRLCLKKVQF